MAKKQDLWIPKKSQIELLQIFASQVDQATALLNDKLKQVATELGIPEEEWASGDIEFDWENFKRTPKE
jgi:hypothetical protein